MTATAPGNRGDGLSRRKLLALLGGGSAAAWMWATARHAVIAQIGTSGELPLDARDFGAVGDGRHDDAPAINRAIRSAASAGGGIVDLHAGTYLLETESLRLASRVMLRGVGPDTLLLLAAGAARSVVTAASDGPEAPIVGSAVENLRVDGNRANQPDSGETYGVNLWSANDCAIRNVHVTDTVRSGIYLAGSRNTVTGCTVTGAGLSGTIGRSGIVFDTDGTNFPVDCLAQNNTVTNVREHGIKVYTGGDGTRIRWNHVEQVGDRGIYVQGSRSTLVDGNTVLSSGTTGILIGDSSGAAADCTVTGNYVRDSASHGILVWGGNRTTIGRDNDVETNGGSGIYILNCRLASVTGNTCVGNRGSGGIVFAGSPAGTIEGNQCLGNNIAGIYFSDEGASPDCAVTANRCRDDGWTQQRFGIYARDGQSSVFLSENEVEGNLISGIVTIDPTPSSIR